MDLNSEALLVGVLQVVIVVLSLSVHEWGHAYAADRLGDDTPRSEGRVTINPLAHIDPIGTVVLPLLGALGFFGGAAIPGWAKPVYINPDNLRRRMFDEAIVTLAGPLMNFLLAFAAALIVVAAKRLGSAEGEFFGRLMLRANVSLFLFNLLPIPPLDGSKFLMYWFGMSRATYARIAGFGWVMLIVLLNVPGFGSVYGDLIAMVRYPFDAVIRVFA